MPKINSILMQFGLISSPKLHQREAFCPGFCVRANLSLYTGVTSRIFAPFFNLKVTRKLKANYLNIISIIFFMIWG